jgi:thiol:disulfide interchange protein DsbD
MGIGRLLTASALLIFAISLVPGMFGAPLGELDAFVPVAQGGGFAGRAASSGPAWMKNQYPEALAKAKQENKLVLVSFTGYACTNCHWMKSNMFPRPEIAEAMKDLVLVELYTDERDEKLADANQKLEAEKLNTVSLPTYAIIDGDGKVLAQSGYTPDAAKFLAFLKTKAAG